MVEKTDFTVKHLGIIEADYPGQDDLCQAVRDVHLATKTTVKNIPKSCLSLSVDVVEILHKHNQVCSERA